jgi:BolA family transcriptional regulator, general stress-responsive regulator
MINNECRIQWIRSQLESALQPTLLMIHDDSFKHVGHEGSQKGAGHFSIEISSSHFSQKSLVECHRLVYDVLVQAIPSEIHALKIKIRC